ncbi:MAG: permease-like cell division protein FtsX [Anaerosomatales bacterium]|nr:permease-like cell division protein FtsX [Anaerosomatales bacterium]MDT8434428.1 permease-like cell division protein FtsX [Anaerosomatales bacterium]
MAINVGYFLRESVLNFRRNWVMSLGAVITIYLSLLLVGVSMVLGVIVSEIVQSVEDKVSIQIFLKDGAATEDVEALQGWLLADEMVDTVNYVSKEDALERFKEEMAGSPEIVENIRENPLPASLDVTLTDPRQVEEMVGKIKANETFLKICDRPDEPEESLKYGQQIVDRLFAFTRIIRLIGVVFVAMLAVVSLIFINNTIRLAIYSRRKEIGIMRLVGASNWFIRAPFLLEGVMQSLLGAALAILTIVAVQAAVLPRLQEAVLFLPVDIAAGMMIQLALVLVVAGVVIGLLGAGFALRRYLKV